MNLINKLNSDAFQKIVLTGNAGQRIIMNLRFIPTQDLWMADFELDDFILKGILIVTSPNILRNYSNIIPFGILVTTTDGQDPRSVNDFESESALMYLLSSDEVQNIEGALFE